MALLDRDRAGDPAGVAELFLGVAPEAASRPRRCRCGRRAGCRSPRRCTPACTSAPSRERRAGRARRAPATRWRNRVRRSCAERRPIPSRRMPIHYTVDDHVVTITIDRPARRNALDLEHFDALADAWKRFRDDPDAWVAIVTGVDDAFCAGGDLRDYLPLLTEALASGSPDDRARFRSGTEAVLRDLDDLQADHRGGERAVRRRRDGAAERHRHPPGVPGGGVRDARTQARPLRQRRHQRTPAAPDPLGGGDGVPPDRRAGAGDTARWRWACSTRSCRARGCSSAPTSGPRASPRTRRWRSRPPRRARCAASPRSRSARRCRSKRASALAVLTSNDAREGPRAFVEKRAPRWTGR